MAESVFFVIGFGWGTIVTGLITWAVWKLHPGWGYEGTTPPATGEISWTPRYDYGSTDTHMVSSDHAPEIFTGTLDPSAPEADDTDENPLGMNMA